MFTGLVEEPRPVVRAATRADGGIDLDVDLGSLREGVMPGDSIAVSGACLTAVRFAGNVATFELSPETLARTHFRGARAGALVNIERALALGARLGGHWVQGHVDGLGAIRRIEVKGEWVELDVKIPVDLSRYCVEKGSITFDGVSLTIAKIAAAAGGESVVTIALIPHTLARTTLGSAKLDDAVHVEVDILAKYVERLAAPYGARP